MEELFELVFCEVVVDGDVNVVCVMYVVDLGDGFDS